MRNLGQPPGRGGCHRHSVGGRLLVWGGPLLAVLPALALGACSLHNVGRSAGTGLVQGVMARRDTLAVATGPAVDSLTFRLTRDLRDSLRPELLSLLAAAGDTALRKVDAIGATLDARLGQTLSAELRDSLRLLLGTASASVRDSVRAALRLWLTEVLTRARSDGGAALAAVADSAVRSGAAALAVALKGPLREDLLALIRAAADTASAGVKPIADGFTDRAKRLLSTLGGKVLIGAIIALLLGLGVLWWLFRKRQRMLGVLTGAIERLGTPELKQTIQQQAAASDVQQNLHRYLKRRGMAAS